MMISSGRSGYDCILSWVHWGRRDALNADTQRLFGRSGSFPLVHVDVECISGERLTYGVLRFYSGDLGRYAWI